MAQGTYATAAARREPLLVELALHRVGTHGAFAWGVIDRLPEEPGLEVDGISGTSVTASITTPAPVLAIRLLDGIRPEPA